MGPSLLSAAELAAWVDSLKLSSARPPEPVEDIARYFIEEGKREGVAGDVAFVQAILETGWFRFSDRMPPSHNNFSGIGAVDGGGSSASFPSARIGVRAQIQHLRAYADRTVNCSNFATPTVTPRCHLVSPKGKAPRWSNMGSGNWATAPDYADKIASLYDRATRHARA
jgi:flagellum-specific peptidoglycan hydrolase FlgJ